MEWTLLLQMSPLVGESTNPGILFFFLKAGPVAKVVLGILALFSLGSWTVMIGKWLQFRRADVQSRRFLDHFHQSKRFSEINAVTSRHASSPLVGVFQAGYVEIDAQVKTATEHKSGNPAAAQSFRVRSLEGVHRSLRRAVSVEVRTLSRYTQFLATTAAATPFIGLFGTVYGIMVAFDDIGASGSASIVAVAPGIAEALVNTAAGLVAAIPALIGYNQLSGKIRGLRSEMEDFALEFLNLTERNFT